MRATINTALISQLKPQEKEYDVRDIKLIGFMIRVNPTGNMVYVCEYKRGRRLNLGKVGILTPTQARDKAQSLLGDVAKGIDPKKDNEKDSVITLQQFIEKDYTPWVLEHRKAGKKTLAHIKRCFYPKYANKPLMEITPVAIDQWRTQRLKDGRAIETVNRDIATFKAALSKAVLWERIEHHPLTKFKLLKSDRNKKVRFLSVDEEQHLRQALKERDKKIKIERTAANEWRSERNYELLPDLSCCQFADHLRPMVLLSLNTGMRRGEVFSLKWENVNLEQALLSVEAPYAKAGKTLHIPLNAEALQVFKAWRQQTLSTDLVFPSKDGLPFDTVKKSWAGVLKSANIKKFRWHDMRHHFASKLVMVGVDLNTVRELLGHADMSMTLRYAHLSPEHKANAVAKLVAENVEL